MDCICVCLSVCLLLQVLIFSQMTTLLDIIEFYLEMKDIDYSRLDGSMSVAVRQEEVGPATSTQLTVMAPWL